MAYLDSLDGWAARLPIAMALTSLAGLAAVGSGCGAAPALGNALGPDYTERPEATCSESAAQVRPLVVDWKSTDRAELEARAKRGPVVVKYEGCSVEVLKRCEIKQAAPYEYIGITPKTDVVKMRDATELHANIPVYAAKFEGKLEKRGSLDVAMTIVGQFDSIQPVASSSDLAGDCDGATHVVTALTVGAYEFFATNHASAGLDVDVMGASAGASESQDKEVLSRDGDQQACGKASGDATEPPFGCGALLRVELVPLGEERAAEPSCPSGLAWDGAQCVAVDTTVSCPEGEIADRDRGCVKKKKEAIPFVAGAAGVLVAPVAASCESIEACQAECDEGSAAGCLGLGGLLRQGLKHGAPTEQGAQSKAAFEKACDADKAEACTALGEMLFQGLGVEADRDAAIPFLEKACKQGDNAGCNDMGLAKQLSGDHSGAKAYFEKVCTPKVALGCLNLGLMYRSGKGVTKDLAKAKQFIQWACDAKVGNACQVLSKM